MQMNIKIALENEVFSGEEMGNELARILRQVAAKISGKSNFALSYTGWSLRDCNGNGVGYITINEREGN